MHRCGEHGEKEKIDREERIAEVQLKAYWELYPLHLDGKQAEHIPLPESDDDELIEDRSLSTGNANETGNRSGSDQELIEEDQCNTHLSVSADRLRSSIKKESCTRMAANNARQKLLKTLHSSIDSRAEAEAKRRKLDPSNSRVREDLKAINRDVERATVDHTHARIHQREPRAIIKRGCIFDGTSQGQKATKREKQAIMNMRGAVMP